MPALSWAVTALVCVAPGSAPWSVEQCVAASDQGQLLKQKGALLAARAQLELCSHPSCPPIVQGACTRWLDEVLTVMPSLIIVARLDGVDQTQVRVLLDEQPWLSELSGKPAEVDPGEHRLTVEVAGQSQQQRLVVNVSEKNRLVVFQFKAPAVPVAPVEPVKAPAPPAAVELSRPAPVVPMLLTGVGLLGVGLFTGLGLSGRSALDQLTASPCAATKTCNPAAVSSISRTFVAADVALAVGVVAAAGAAWQWWSWSSLAVTPAVSPEGGGVAVSGRW